MPDISAKVLSLHSPCSVYIDWANVHGWKKSLKREVSPQKLFKYLKTYKEVKNINFYFGTDKHPKSKQFIKDVNKIGYSVSTKPVKYITVTNEKNQRFKFRKCDFDMEMCIDVHRDLSKGIKGFVFFTGDGDFSPLYQLLIENRKQVIVVYMHGHLGREIYQIQKGLYKVSIDKLEQNGKNRLTKNAPRTKPGA